MATVAILSLLGLTGIVLRSKLEPMVTSNLISMVSESTEGAFELRMSRLKIHLLSGGFSMDDVSLKSDSTRIEVKRIDVRRIHVIRFLRKRVLDIGLIRFDTPSFDHTPSAKRTETDSLPPPMERLYDAIRPGISSIRINTIQLNDGTVSIRHHRYSAVVGRIDSLSVTIRMFTIDSTATLPTDIDLSIASGEWTVDSAPYRIQGGRIDVSTSAQRLTVSELKWVPLADYETFAMSYRRHNRVAFSLKTIDLSGWKADAFIRGEGFFASTLSLVSPSLEVAHDKRLPPKPFRVRKLMHLMINDIPMPVDIQHVDISDGLIVYRHRHVDDRIPAVLRFDGLVARLNHVSNIGSEAMTLHTETRVMGEGRLTVDARFEPNSAMGRHRVTGSFRRSSFAAFNPVLEHLLFLKAEEGYLNRMEFEMDLDDRASTGRVTLDYEGVRIRMIGDGKRFRTFIANRFIINTDHTGKAVKPSRIAYVRLREKNIFHYWWMSLLSGMKPVLGM